MSCHIMSCHGIAYEAAGLYRAIRMYYHICSVDLEASWGEMSTIIIENPSTISSSTVGFKGVLENKVLENKVNHLYTYCIIFYMRNLPGWLETRLAQNTLNYT